MTEDFAHKLRLAMKKMQQPVSPSALAFGQVLTEFMEHERQHNADTQATAIKAYNKVIELEKRMKAMEERV